MIPADTIADLAELGFTPEQTRAVAAILRAVEDATHAEGQAAIESRRVDRDRKTVIAKRRHVT